MFTNYKQNICKNYSASILQKSDHLSLNFIINLILLKHFSLFSQILLWKRKPVYAQIHLSSYEVTVNFFCSTVCFLYECYTVEKNYKCFNG